MTDNTPRHTDKDIRTAMLEVVKKYPGSFRVLALLAHRLGVDIDWYGDILPGWPIGTKAPGYVGDDDA